MLSVLNSFRAAFTDFTVQNILGKEVGTCAELIFEVEPGKNLDLVGND
jgi:hypothetical protein